MVARPANTTTPEEQSKALVRHEYTMIEAQAEHLGWACRLADRGDYLVVYVRVPKPVGRVFVLRIECDDYPWQAPEVRFVDPQGWDETERQDRVDPSFHPRGSWVTTDRGPLPIMCLRGHRDYYRAGWHGGWMNPPAAVPLTTTWHVSVAGTGGEVWEDGSTGVAVDVSSQASDVSPAGHLAVMAVAPGRGTPVLEVHRSASVPEPSD
jgi:hypothetical protein